MRRDQAQALDAVPGDRRCTVCGATVRFSHTTYVGRGEAMAIHRCSGCGIQYRGSVRDRDEQRDARQAARSRRKPLPEGGSPDNPVLDEEMARRLRETLGGG